VHQGFLEDVIMLCRQSEPFIEQTLGQAEAKQVQQFIEQAQAEMEQPDFCCIVYRLDAWGYTPADVGCHSQERNKADEHEY
jgi:hypothetical protein